MRKKSLEKALLWLFTAAMVLALCACGGRSEAAAPKAQETAQPAAPAAEPTPEPTPEPAPEPTPEPIVGELLTDDDGDGIIYDEFNYRGARCHALIVLDPSRVFVGTALMEPSPWGGYGLTLDVLAEQYGAVAGINAGGFPDDGGGGSGGGNYGITYSRGINFSDQQVDTIAGLDKDNHLWVGNYSFEECESMGIRDAVCFGPDLVINGVKADPDSLEVGIGARTAIGQREDGVIVMLVIDGRQGYSVGVTFGDCLEIMADKYGCINVANMDGGNSSCMYYNGAAMNRSANPAGGTRDLPNAWLVRPLEDGYVKSANVPDYIVLPENVLGEVKEYVAECDAETSARLFEFATVFTEAYYGYFGTRNSDYYYPTLMQYVAQRCDLRNRATLALMDRMWVNTWRTDAANLTLNGAYQNADGSYDIIVTSDIYEYSTYWNYEAPGSVLRITVVEAPESPYGFLATATY